MGWKCGCQLFSCRCSQNVTHCRKEICSTCLFKESIPATPFGNFNHPLPARSRFLIAAARSTTSTLWLRHADPFVAAAGKNLSHAAGVDTRMWALLRSQGAKSDCVSIKGFGTGTKCHVQDFSNNLILASYIV